MNFNLTAMNIHPILSAFLAVIILAAIGSCSGGSGEADSLSTFRPLEETSETEDLIPYIDKMELVRLSDDPRLLFSDVAKMLIDREGHFYILDYGGKLVTVSPDGTFYRKFSGKGRASNEYMSIVDIALTDSELVILDGPKAKFFDLDVPSGCRVVDIPSGIPYDAVAPAGEDGLYLFSAFPAGSGDAGKENEALLYKVSKDGSITGTYIPHEDCTFSMSNISQSCGNTYYLRPQDSRHVFYRLEGDAPVAACRIDFQGQSIPERYYYNEAGEDMMQYMMSDRYKLPMDLHETDSHFYFHASGPGASDCIFIYDKRSRRGIRWTNAPGSVTVMTPVLASDSDWFYTVLPELDPAMMELKGDPLYDSAAAMLSSAGQDVTSGPYIVKFRLKPID